MSRKAARQLPDLPLQRGNALLSGGGHCYTLTTTGRTMASKGQAATQA